MDYQSRDSLRSAASKMSIALICGALCIALLLLRHMYKDGQGFELIGAYHFFAAHFWPLFSCFIGATFLGAVFRLSVVAESGFFAMLSVLLLLIYITFFAGSYGHPNAIGVCYFLVIGWAAGLFLTGFCIQNEN